MSTGDPSAAKVRDAADAAAMARLAQGDESALAELYDRYSPLALGLALKITREQGEAEDVVHDAFVAVVERADQYRPDRGTVAAWLVTTVRNLSLDRSRRRVRRAQITEEELRHEPLDTVSTPESLTAAAATQSVVRRALEGLAPAQRRALELAFFEGLSYPEIAERENIPLGTVKSRAARALAALRDALAGLDDELKRTGGEPG